MLGIVLGLCASLCWGTSDFLGGLESRRHHQLGVMVSSAIVACALVGGVVAVSDGPPPQIKYLLEGAAGGLSVTIALLAFYRALAIGVMSVVAPIAASGVIIPVVVGLVGGERPSVLRLAGTAVAIVGVLLVSRHRDGATQAAAPGRSVALAVIAAAGFGGQLVALHDAARGGPLWGALASVVTCTVAVSIAAAVAAARGEPVRPIGSAVPGVLALGIAWGAATACYASATRHGQLSAVSVAASLYPAVTVLMARVALRERVRRIQEVGIVTALAGILMIAAG
jgi:drug/metabolite transporter (DMT)-like permease